MTVVQVKKKRRNGKFYPFRPIAFDQETMMSTISRLAVEAHAR